MNPLLAQLEHPPFPELAEIIRLGADEIMHQWDVAVRNAMPRTQHLTFEELKEATPQTLSTIADALASDDSNMIRSLLCHSLAQGISRSSLNFDLAEVMQEDRLLRAIIVEHVETELSRQMDSTESAALHAIIDVMQQRSVIALVEQQKSQLRAAAEKELKFLSFRAHDLNNHLYGVTLLLHELKHHLKQAGGFTSAEECLTHAQDSIHDTVVGLRRMLDHAKLRNSSEKPKFAPVDLHPLVTRVTQQFSREADAKGVMIANDVRPGTTVTSDAELLSLVLQNLIGNGVKYSTAGAVRIGSKAETRTGRRVISISDQGPGIAQRNINHIFDAFKRGEVHGQRGVGLGLAIASEAAKLLGAEITVDSELGVGSTFRLTLLEQLKPECVSQGNEVMA